MMTTSTKNNNIDRQQQTIMRILTFLKVAAQREEKIRRRHEMLPVAKRIDLKGFEYQFFDSTKHYKSVYPCQPDKKR